MGLLRLRIKAENINDKKNFLSQLFTSALIMYAWDYKLNNPLTQEILSSAATEQGVNLKKINDRIFERLIMQQRGTCKLIEEKAEDFVRTIRDNNDSNFYFREEILHIFKTDIASGARQEFSYLLSEKLAQEIKKEKSVKRLENLTMYSRIADELMFA